MARQKIALVTGANRGIGLEVARQLGALGYRVILTARKKTAGREAVKKLARAGFDVEFAQLDVTDANSAKDLARHIKKTEGRLDVLVNNAAVLIDTNGVIGSIKAKEIVKTFETNTLVPLMVSQALAKLMPRGGRIVNVSSGAGEFQHITRDQPAYRISKVALNAITVMMADQFGDYGIRVNSVCPGWVRTDMGGRNADLSVKEGADTIVWLASSAPSRLTGKFFRARKEIKKW